MPFTAINLNDTQFLIHDFCSRIQHYKFKHFIELVWVDRRVKVCKVGLSSSKFSEMQLCIDLLMLL